MRREEGERMRAWKISALLATVLLAGTAFAAVNKASVEIQHDTVVGGKTLSAGKYTLTWEGQGPNVDLSIAQGKQVVAKTPARLVDLPKALINGAVITKANADGTSALSQIQFSGKKYALEVGEPTDVASRVK
jgi:hypothetical protein